MNCGEVVEDILITEGEEDIHICWSKIPIHCTQKHAFCNKCGEEIYVAKVSDENIYGVWESFHDQQPEKFIEGSWVKSIYENKVEIK